MNATPPILNPSEGTSLFEPAKRRAALLSMAMVAAVLWPVHENWLKDPEDSFPLSYYPMFSNRRDPVETFYYVLGLDAQGKRHYIPHRMIGEGGGNQIRRQLRKIMKEGRATELAESVADKMAKRDSGRWSRIVSVQVCRGKYAVNDFFRGNKEPVSERIEGSAQVERRTS